MQLGEDAAAAAWWGERLEKRSEVTAVQRQEDLRAKHGHHKVPVQNILHIYIYISYINI